MSRSSFLRACSWVLALVLLALWVPSNAWAVRVYPDPWPNQPNTTTNDWDFTHDLDHPVYSDGPGPGQFVDHSAFEPGATMVPTGVYGQFVTGSVWYTPTGGPLTFLIPNYPDPNYHKLIQVQFTSDKSGVASTPGGVVLPGGGAAMHGGTWYTYQWWLEIQPNPPSELISITFPYNTNVEQVHIDTICEVPLPAAAWGGAAVLGSMAALAGLRRRFAQR